MVITNNLTPSQRKYIINSIRQKGIPYITPKHVLDDIDNNRLYTILINDKPVAMCSLVWDDKFQYYAIKRLVVFRKQNNKKGYANTLIDYCINLGLYPLGCTPWKDNVPMCHLLTKHDFTLEYIFQEKWCFFKKTLDK